MSWIQNAKVGDQVVYIGDEEPAMELTAMMVGFVSGNTYTIEEMVEVPPGYAQSGQIALVCKGVPAPITDSGKRWGPMAHAFRPVEETPEKEKELETT